MEKLFKMSLDDFERYCMRFSNSIYTEEQPAHKALVRSLAKDSQRFGIKNVRAAYTEVVIVEDNIEIGSIDAVLFADKTYVCEVKVTDKWNAGSFQLEKAYEYVKNNFGVLVTRFSVRKNSRGKIRTTKTPPATLDVMAQAGI